METKIWGFQNPKPGSKSRRRNAALNPPPSLSAGLYGPGLAVKGSASPRFAPLAAPGRAWGRAVYEGKGELQRGGDLHPDAVAQRSGFARPRGEAPLLSRIKASPPQFFEQLVVEVLLKMGYGGSRKDAGEANWPISTRPS